MRMKKVFLFVFIVLIGTSLFAKNVFRGEVYKISKYAKQVICRGPDLSMIDVGQKLYISDENNKLIATVEITRYYTTIIETKLISGNINKIRVKMPVYTSKKQFAMQKIKKIKYEKDYDYYLWDVDVIYDVDGQKYKLPSKIIFPKIFKVRGKGYDEPVSLAMDEVDRFYVKYSEGGRIKITDIKLKDGSSTELEEISVVLHKRDIPEKEWYENQKFGKKKYEVGIEDTSEIILKKRGKGVKFSTWDKTYGGSKDDKAYSIQQTKDGGFIVAGRTSSKGVGKFDAWVLRLNREGDIIWDKTYGGSKDDEAKSIQQTKDGGFIVAGWTLSKGSGGYDVWVLRLNSKGDIIWDKTYGGSEDDKAYSIQQTKDGGFIMAGRTSSKGVGKFDAWVLRLNSEGYILWDQTYGGKFNGDGAYSIQQAKDGGFIVAGRTASKGVGMSDTWVLRLDSEGYTIWEKIYGGKLNGDGASSIQQTKDGGFIVAGYRVPTFSAKTHTWVLRLNSEGDIIWDKTYGGSDPDAAYSIQQTKDGGFIMAGWRKSKGVRKIDAWILRLDREGDIMWDKTYGGSDPDAAYSIQQTKDGGYIVAGWTKSKGAGKDAWILRLDRNGNVK